MVKCPQNKGQGHTTKQKNKKPPANIYCYSMSDLYNLRGWIASA